MNVRTVIHIVDDDKSFRTAITRLLVAHGYMVTSYGSAEEYLSNKVVDRGCLLLDVRMPGISGLQAQAELAERSHSLPIVFVTGHGDIPMSVRAIKAGAEDFLTKPIPSARLLTAIESALNRYDETWMQKRSMNELHERFAKLTPREVEVFRAVVSGKLNKVVADELGTVERTIKAHRHQVMEKMQATSLAELVGFSRQLFQNQTVTVGKENKDGRPA